MKIILDRSLCIGAGRCAEMAPKTFATSDNDGLVVLIASDAPRDEDWVAQAAVDACPSGALRIESGE